MGLGKYIFMDGEFVDRTDAKVSVFDHGLLYGDGIFEGIRAYDGNVFRLREHIERLYDSAKSLLLNIPYDKSQMAEIVCETLRQNNYQTAYIRLLVTRGVGNLGLDPFLCPTSQVIVITEALALFPKELYTSGISVICASTRRNRSDVLNPKIKSLNYLNNILIKMEAHTAGVSEALVLNTEGYVVEGSGENIFIVKNGKLYTPPTYLGALEGITRAAVMELAGQQQVELSESPFTRHDVYVADEVFLTGTAAELIPVVKVDDRVIGDGQPGPMTRTLHAAFHARTTVDGVRIYPTQVISEGA